MKKLSAVLLILLGSLTVCAQVAINDNNALPHASAILDINSTNANPKKGILFPRVTEAQKGLMTNAATGLMVYQTDGVSGFYYNRSQLAGVPNWTVISEKSNFWQTSIANSNDILSTNTGNVGIGTTNPTTGKFQVQSTTGNAGHFLANLASPGTHAVHGEYNGTQADAVGVFGKSKPADYYGIGGVFEGGYRGMTARVDATGTASYQAGAFTVAGATGGTSYGVTAVASGAGSIYAISGLANGGTTSNFGIYANATGGGTTAENYGIYAVTSNGSADGAAGYFSSANANAIETATGNVGIGGGGVLRAKLNVNGSVGAVAAMFHAGAGGPGIAIENNYPGIGFNSYYSGARKYIGTGHAGSLTLDPTSGDLSYYASSTSGTANNAAATSLKFIMSKEGMFGLEGNSDPQAPLSFAQTIGKKISLYRGPTGDVGMGVYGNEFRMYSDNSNADITFGYDHLTNGFTERVRMKANGSVGIGTNAPTTKLDVNGRLHLRKDGAFGSGIWIDGPDGIQNNFFGMFDDQNFGFYSNTSGWRHLFDVNDGTVRLGTTQKATGYLLNVGGKIISEEVRVQLTGAWPDYVFAKNYQLKPLEQVEQFIKANQHLPNMPSAAEVEKNGQLLGDLQRKMMEKIEELTLYVIDLKKEIEALKKEQATLKN